MQYRLFSSNKTWLPKIPDYVPTQDALHNFELYVMEPKQYDTVGGEMSFDAYAGVSEKDRQSDRNGTVLRRILNRREVLDEMAQMEATAILQAEIHCEDPDNFTDVNSASISDNLKQVEMMTYIVEALLMFKFRIWKLCSRAPIHSGKALLYGLDSPIFMNSTVKSLLWCQNAMKLVIVMFNLMLNSLTCIERSI
jgi:hypothetical protein